MPESLLSIHDQVDADTISGSSHGTRNSARSVPDSGKLRWKNTASASPIANWKTSETTVKTTVLTQRRPERRVVRGPAVVVEARRTARCPATKERTV